VSKVHIGDAIETSTGPCGKLRGRKIAAGCGRAVARENRSNGTIARGGGGTSRDVTGGMRQRQIPPRVFFVGFIRQIPGHTTTASLHRSLPTVQEE
jgi:hypothetical protein